MPSRTEAIQSAVVDRLAAELGDASLGSEVGDLLDPRAIAVFAAQPELVDGDLLSFSPTVEPEPEMLIVFAFGNRFDVDGLLLPGPVNIALARLADEWAQSTGLPVFAQWEVADEMGSEASRIGVVELEDGSIEYLSTAGVAEQVRTLVAVERVAVLAMADHAVRCCRTFERFGIAAGVPDGVDMPSVYDPRSGQPWTRDRASYVAIDILARCLT